MIGRWWNGSFDAVLRGRQRLLVQLLGWLITCSAVAPAALAAPPDDREQYWFYLVNRFRQDPAAELQRLVDFEQTGEQASFAIPASPHPAIARSLDHFQVDPAVLWKQFQALRPVPPLAWSESLHESAAYYSDQMLSADRQAHDLDGWNLLERVQNAGGFDFAGGGAVGENLFAFTQDVLFGHAALVIDWGNAPAGIQSPPGHRNNLLNLAYREIGIGVVPQTDRAKQVGPLITTQHLAVDFADGPYVSGILWQDSDQSGEFSLGEGIGLPSSPQAVPWSVSLRDVSGNTRIADATVYGTGGLRIDLGAVAAGTYRLSLDHDDLIWMGETFEVDGTTNVWQSVGDPQHDLDALTRAVRSATTWSLFDLNADGRVSLQDREWALREIYRSWFGDADLNQSFDEQDLLQVFQAGEYEDDLPGNSRWRTGDWNGDLEVDTQDLLLALQDGGYRRGAYPADGLVVNEPQPVPEPVGGLALVWLVVLGWRHPRLAVRPASERHSGGGL